MVLQQCDGCAIDHDGPFSLTHITHGSVIAKPEHLATVDVSGINGELYWMHDNPGNSTYLQSIHHKPEHNRNDEGRIECAHGSVPSLFLSS